MVVANELRIGNYLKDQDGLIVVVKGIDSDRSYEHKGKLHVGTAQCYYNEYNGTTGKWLETLNPIPLTEEVLLKCGFMGNESSYYLHKDFASLHLEKPFLDSAHYLVKTILGDKLTSVKSVHQLQNLLFATTGKELEIHL